MKKIIFYLLTLVSLIPSLHAQKKSAPQAYQHCWQGNLGENIPVFLYYQKQGALVVGKMVYLNTKAQQPIPIIGHWSENNLRFNEYAVDDGSITGIWVLKIKNDSLTGTWYAPSVDDAQYAVELTEKDTVIPSEKINYLKAINGVYRYQYGKKGQQGSWDIRKIDAHNIIIKASSVTRAPARNLAYISVDTVELHDNYFLYKAGMKDCEIVMKGTFYPHFLEVKYINTNPCSYYFGFNATLEGVFYKTKLE